MKKSIFKKILLLLVLILAFVGLAAGYPRVREYIFQQQELSSFNTKGGAEIILQVDMNGVPTQERGKVFEESRNVIFKRIRLMGFYPFIQTSQNQSDYRMTVQIAHVGDLDELVRLVGQTTKLEFRELADQNAPQGTPVTMQNTKPSGISGKDLQSATLSYSQSQSSLAPSQPVVDFEIRSSSITAFSALTKRLIGKPLAVALDDQIISYPTVQSEISDRGQITGLTVAQAKLLAIQLNAGSIPAPVKVLGEKYVKR